MSFYFIFASFLLAIWFRIHAHAQLSPEISWFYMYLKSEQSLSAYRPYTSEEIQNVMLFCNTDNITED